MSKSIAPTPQLSSQQIRRYGRHLVLDQVGIESQRKICASSVLVVGAGGLGSAVLLSLAGAGIGRIGIVDHDVVSINNLHRQLIYREKDDNKYKADCAKEAILNLNSALKIEIFTEKFTNDNARNLVREYDVIADCTDNIEARYVISDHAVVARKPLVSAAAIGTEGQLAVYNYKGRTCLRCVFPEKSPPETIKNCSDNGVLGVVPSIMGSLQALEILKIAGGFGNVLSKLLYLDSISLDIKKVQLGNRICELCSAIKSSACETAINSLLKKFHSNSPPNIKEENIDMKEISCKYLDKVIKDTNSKPFVLIDVRPDVYL